ncbi:MAG: sensor histidine kinase [Anaerolineales bacterium]
MSETERSQVQEILEERRTTIARAWFEKLDALSAVKLDAKDWLPRLEAFTDELIALLTAKSFDPAKAQEVGVALEEVDNLQPPAIIEMQTALGAAFSEAMPAEVTPWLQPRLVAVLGAFLAGFFTGKVERAKRFDMDAMSDMGHDLKTPINAITGFSRVILKGIDGPITEFQQQDLTSIYEGGKKLLTMIDDIFQVAKKDAAKTSIYAVSFPVATLLGDVITTVQPIVARHDHTLEVCAVGALGAMRTDASKVRWVLVNALLYASRLTKHRTLTLTSMRERVVDTDWIVFEIAEELPDERKSTPVREDDGDMPDRETASLEGELGLVTCQRFCEQLGGAFIQEQEDDEAEFIKFTVRLPVRSRT